MFIAYDTFTIVTIAYSTSRPTATLSATSGSVTPWTKGVPRAWVPLLGIPKAAALGLVAGFWIPALGMAAAAGLLLFFGSAIVTTRGLATTRSFAIPVHPARRPQLGLNITAT